jgi:hypothetical protein
VKGDLIMPRKHPNTRIFNLYKKYNKGDFKISFAEFSPVTCKLENHLKAQLSKNELKITKKVRGQHCPITIPLDNVLCYLEAGYGTIEIKDSLSLANTAEGNPFSDVELNKVVVQLCAFIRQRRSLATEQPWFSTYILSNETFQPIASEFAFGEHKHLCLNFYSPAVFIKQIVEKLSPKEHAEIMKSATPCLSFNTVLTKIEENFKEVLNKKPACILPNIQPEFVKNVSDIGLNRLEKNKDLFISVDHLSTINVSAIFKSLSLSKKTVIFLKENGASLKTIELYSSLVKNPILFFKLKMLAADSQKAFLLKELNALILKFNSLFIQENAPELNEEERFHFNNLREKRREEKRREEKRREEKRREEKRREEKRREEKRREERRSSSLLFSSLLFTFGDARGSLLSHRRRE